MLVYLLLLCCLVGCGIARPAQNAELVAKRAKMYALLYPNDGSDKSGEYGENVEGDILIRGDESPDVSNPLNAVADERLKWPMGTAYYTIQNGVYTATEVRLIEEGIADLQRLTMVNGKRCITILPRNNEANYISVENYSGCSSYVGMVGRSQRMSLVPSCIHNRHGTIMHEFLHAFGFHHEQKRSDRDDYVDINWSNIQSGTENNFVKLTPAQVNLLGTKYDYGSVMHYSAYAFAIDPTIPTIIPHTPAPNMGQRVTLSQLDIERVQIFYGCLAPADSVYFKHVDMNDYFKKTE